MTEERIREICKSFVSGMNAEQIAAVEGMDAAFVELLLADHAKECCEIQAYLEQMGWTLTDEPAPVLLVRSSAALAHGIDVSKHQGTINWDAVAADPSVQFAILRAGYGRYESQVDTQWARNYAECKRLRIPVGAYWYSYAATPADAATEGRLFAQVLAGKQFEYPVYFDQEDGSIPAAQRTACALAFFAALGPEWYKGYYSYTAWMPSVELGSIRQHCDTVWLADYRANPDQTIQRDMHQYTSSGTVAGIGGRVDCNRAYVGFPALIKGAGKNGFEKEETNMDFVAVKNLMLEVTSAEKPACQAFFTPDVNDGNYRNLALGQYQITGVGPTVTLGGMQGTWYRIDLSGEEWYCLALPDRCKVVEVAEETQPEQDLTEVLEGIAALDKVLDGMDGKLDQMLEKLELVQQALEDPAAQQVLDKLEKAGAALVE